MFYANDGRNRKPVNSRGVLSALEKRMQEKQPEAMKVYCRR